MGYFFVFSTDSLININDGPEANDDDNEFPSY